MQKSFPQFLPYSMQILPDKKVFAVGGYGENRIYFVETENFEVVERSELYTSGVNCVDFSRNFFAFGLANSTCSLSKFVLAN